MAAGKFNMQKASGGVASITVADGTTNTVVVLPESGTVATTTDVGTANSYLVKTALNASGTAPIYACRAWVNFNGTGTVAIRASGNVSSITDNGTGTYTVNFTTAMQDTNYVASGLPNATAGNVSVVNIIGFTISSFAVYTFNTASTVPIDREFISISIFR